MIVLNVNDTSISSEIDNLEEFNKYFISSSKLVSQHVGDDGDSVVSIFCIDLADYHHCVKVMYENQ